MKTVSMLIKLLEKTTQNNKLSTELRSLNTLVICHHAKETLNNLSTNQARTTWKLQYIAKMVICLVIMLVVQLKRLIYQKWTWTNQLFFWSIKKKKLTCQLLLMIRENNATFYHQLTKHNLTLAYRISIGDLFQSLEEQ